MTHGKWSPLNWVMTRITQMHLQTDESEGTETTTQTRTRKNLSTMVVHDEHVVIDVERATTPDDIIPMIIIEKNNNVCVVGTMVVPWFSDSSSTSRITSILTIHRYRSSVIVILEDRIVHLVIDNTTREKLTFRHSRYTVPITLITWSRWAAYEEEVIRRYRVLIMTESVKGIPNDTRDEGLRVSAPEKYSGEDDIEIFLYWGNRSTLVVPGATI